MRVGLCWAVALVALVATSSCHALKAKHKGSSIWSRRARHLLSTTGVPSMRFQNMRDGVNVSSCEYQEIVGKCSATNNYLLAAALNMTDVPFGGRALAFTVAANAYCGQFDRASANCSYPCQNNGETCALAGALNYGIYACPGSQAQDDVYCMMAPGANASLCNATSECQEMPGVRGPARCIAKFKNKFASNQFRQYLSDWGTTRRNVWGCCDGSNSKWMSDVYCSRFSSLKDECNTQTECVYDDIDGSCSWSSTEWLDYNLGPSKLTTLLQGVAEECSAITDQDECNSYKPVAVSPAAVRSILRFDLSSINKRVPASKCVVWTADDTR